VRPLAHARGLDSAKIPLVWHRRPADALESCLSDERVHGRFAVEATCAGLAAVVSVWHCDPVYNSSTRNSLCSADVRPVVQGMVRHDLEAWLWDHPDEARAIVRHVLERALIPWPVPGPFNAAAPVP
jgi:hypothetical protein